MITQLSCDCPIVEPLFFATPMISHSPVSTWITLPMGSTPGSSLFHDVVPHVADGRAARNVQPREVAPFRELAAIDLRHLVGESDDGAIVEIVGAVFHLANLVEVRGDGYAALAIVAEVLVIIEVEFPALLARTPIDQRW